MMEEEIGMKKHPRMGGRKQTTMGRTPADNDRGEIAKSMGNRKMW